MKATDINKFKGDFKTAIQEWVEYRIDELFPNKPQTKVLLKRGLNNYLSKADGKLNGMIDNSLLFITDENGTIDTDVAIDMFVDMFKEMDIQEYKIGMIPIVVGKGEIVAELPHNPLLDMVVGNLGKVKITSADFLELKELFTT
jgi:hypothetical protein|nr:MAG TPA: hypothetical protein [Caudoviricetes sp.]